MSMMFDKIRVVSNHCMVMCYVKVLIGSLKERGQFTVMSKKGEKDEKSISYDTSNMVFIFISDIGMLF